MLETKHIGGHVTETKVQVVNGVEVGTVSGYIAAWSVDDGPIPDKFVRGAFRESIERHRKRGNRQVRLKDHHGRTVGGFPIDGVYEDEIGLFGTGHINLEVQQGKEAFSLARQGVLTDFSVGFSAKRREMENGIRIIYEAELYEGSIVDEPMNPDARILEVKRMNFDWPVASGDYAWDADAARERVEALPLSEVKSRAIQVGDHLVVDVVDGKVTLVPEAVQVVAEELKSQEKPEAESVRLVERLLAQLNLESPFDERKRQFFGVSDVKSWTPRDLERALVRSGAFSNGAAKLVIKNLVRGEEKSAHRAEGASDLLGDLAAMREVLGG